MDNEPLGNDQEGQPVFLKDIWPSQREIQDTILKSVRSEMFQSKYAEVFAGDEHWNSLPTPEGDLYEWDPKSTYVKNPPYFTRHDGQAGRDRARSKAPACWRYWATASRPTTSRRPARSRRTARPGDT